MNVIGSLTEGKMLNISVNGNAADVIKEGLLCLAENRGFTVSDNGISVEVIDGCDGYSIKGKDGQYTLKYGQKCEFFRAISILVGLIEKGDNEIDIWAKGSFEMCGVMLDCSRRAVPKKETVIKLLARIAMMGMNTFMLYTEDVYELEEYKYFGYMRGKYSKAELIEIASVAKSLGIELIPCIQTLGHLKSALRWEYANDMKDDADVLLIDEEKTYTFIESMVKFWREVCDTEKIHIGMDEAEGVGLGEYLNRHGYCDRFEIMTRHVERVLKITKKYGFKPMMWSDMFFKIGSEKRDYYDLNTKIPDWLSEKIPEDVSLVYWDYYHEDKNFYNTMLKNHKKLSERILFAGGAWTWRGLGPLFKKTFDTSFPALAACREQSIKNVFVTIWHDDGAEVNFNTMLPGIQLFAEYNYSETVDIGMLNNNFKLCTGYDAEAFYALDLDSLEAKQRDALCVSKQVLYQDVLCGLFDKNNSCYDLKSIYIQKLEKIKSFKAPKGMTTLFEYYKALLELLIKKCDIGINIRKAYEEKNKQLLLRYADDIDGIYSACENYHDILYKLWHETNKTLGFEQFEIRIGGVLLRLKTAQRKLREYCKNEITEIGELEEKLLWFGGDNTEGMLLETFFYDSMHI